MLRIWKHIITRGGDSDSESEAEEEVVQDNQHHPAAATENNEEINSEGETVKSKEEMKQSGPAENLALSDKGVALKWLPLTLLIIISFYWPCN